MGNSPRDTIQKVDTKSPVQTNAEPPKAQNGDLKLKLDDTVKAETTTAEPLAPPPRPAGPIPQTPDYFSANHGLSHETNPFEFSFGGGASSGGQVQTPGGTKLPSVAALTSPAGILGTGAGTPNFWGSLRSGPLSPAMLSGPQKEDYFSDGHHLRGGFPTPNESGLRSGLTPGGGGSMFPEPSPNSHALYASLASGAATPTTLDFHRTAINAAATQKREPHQVQPNITSQPQEIPNGLDVKPTQGQFDQHDANDAANGLFLLAQARNGPQNTNHYTMAQPMSVHAHPQAMHMGGQSQETSPHMANRNGGSISTTSGRGDNEMDNNFSDDNEQSRPNTRGKNKRNSTQEIATVNGGRRKATEPAAKGPANKKSKANNGNAMSEEPPSDDEQQVNQGDEYHANGKKMTDEEKRKNFLERNRVAALKCRQRKKQWLQNLQNKVEMYTAENDSLNAQVSALRDEVTNLKTILLAHKECPVSVQQGISGMSMHQMLDGYHGQMNPYGMAQHMNAQQQQQVMASQGMQRRFS